MAKRHLTQAIVDTTPFTPKGKRLYIWDEDCPGLALVVNPTTKTWRWQFDRWAEGKKTTLNDTLDGGRKLRDARDWAKEQTNLAKRGAFDPKPEEPKGKPVGPEAWTVKDALDKRLKFMEAEGYSESSIADFGYAKRYLAPIHDVKLGELTRTKCQEVHALISKTGLRGTRGAPVQANKALDYLSATWLHAKDKFDDHNGLPHRADNPCSRSITRNAVGKVQDSITADELPQWAAIVAGLTPVKRNMHMIGLFTGLRWKSLQRIERTWVQGNVLVIPPEAIKSRRGVSLPLSTQLVTMFEDAAKAADFIAPKSKYLFPSPTAEEGFMATDDERALKDTKKGGNERWNGKLKRKTYYTQAGLARVPDKVRSALMDHSVPGLRGNYEHQHEMMDDLRKWQQVISDRLEMLCNAKTA